MTAKRIWRIVKAVLMFAILGWVGFRFYELLADARQGSIAWDYGRLPLAGFWYLAGLIPSALFWWWAMRRLHQHPGPLQAFRAYLIGHLGKYIPGKALVVVMRAALIRGPKVSLTVAAFAVVYETLTCMAGGGLIVVAFLLLDRELAHGIMDAIGGRVEFLAGREWLVHAIALATIVPVLPWVFNPLSRRLVAPFRKADATPLPPFDVRLLLGGVLLGGSTWFFMGMSLLEAVNAVHPVPMNLHNLLHCTVFVTIATVVAFWTPMPSGLGVREAILWTLLAGVFPAELTVESRLSLGALTALLLRITWMATELLLAAILYPLPMLTSLRSPSLKALPTAGQSEVE